MNISFESKENTFFGDVVISWYVKSPVNEYRIMVTFIGGIDDESGEENLESSLYAMIEINETRENNPDVLDKVTEKLKKQEIEIERNAETVMISAPSIRESISYTNESDFYSTMKDFYTIIEALTSTLIQEEIIIDMERSGK